MEPWPAGYGREVHAELDSTNDEALRRAAAGEAGPLWLLARAQTAARGRRGRAWSTLPGNLAATLLMRPPGPPALAALRSFAAALALHDALVQATGRPQLFALKWPNDVLLAGAKLAGILLETGPGAAPALAIGFGVNLAAAPDAASLEPGAVPPVSLRAATGVAMTPDEFLDLLAPAFAHWERRLSGEGFAPLRAAWLARAARLGEPVTARLPGRSVSGRFETIDPSGALVLATATGRVLLPAAELHFAGDPDLPRPPGPDVPQEVPPEPPGPDVPPGVPPGPPETPPGAPPEAPPGAPPEAPPGPLPELPPSAPPEIPPGTPIAAREPDHAARH
jgi:BirA family biotin operon repressor/biotin-[acetyl-CoA-carboxylase] ligase